MDADRLLSKATKQIELGQPNNYYRTYISMEKNSSQHCEGEEMVSRFAQ
jgi:hypothetical protein